jgi:RHS repeat-associated protein
LPFGEEWCGTAICGAVTAGQPKRFTGKERDAETGLDYFGARYYGSKIGRFTTTDPFLDQRAALVNPQRWNRYAYGLNNPLRNIDPDGKDTIDLAIGFGQGIGSAAVGVVTGSIALITQPVATLSAAGQDVRLLGYGVANPGVVWDQYVQMAVSANDADQRALGSAIGQGTFVAAASLAPFAESAAARVTQPYKRPSGATTAEQRAAVQGQPCVECGQVAPKMYADHKTPLVKEYYETGGINKTRMRDPGSTQPSCPTCSARQGAEMSRYSAAKKKDLGL